MDEKSTARWLKRAREQNDFTQAQLAKKIGVTQGAIALWESGNHPPSRENMDKLESLLGPVDTAGASSLPLEGSSHVGDWLAKARDKAGLTRAQLAQKAGLSIPTIYNIEKGQAGSPRDTTIKLLEDALGTRLDSESERELRAESTVEGLGDLRDFTPLDEKTWPDGPGVYILYDISMRPVYVGQSKEMKSRIKDHHGKKWFIEPFVHYGKYLDVADRNLRKQIETILIKFLDKNAVINQKEVERED